MTNNNAMAMGSGMQMGKMMMMQDSMKENKGKTCGALICQIVMATAMIVVYGYFCTGTMNPDTRILVEEKWSLFNSKYNWDLENEDEKELENTYWTRLAKFEEAHFTWDEKMQWMGDGFCFYTPTQQDGIQYQIPDFKFDADN